MSIPTIQGELGDLHLNIRSTRVVTIEVRSRPFDDSSSIDRGGSFAPRSSHHRSSDSKLPANAGARAASTLFRFRKFGETLSFYEALLNPAGKAALRKIREIVETPCVGKYAIKLLLVLDVGKEVRHRLNSMRLFLANAERPGRRTGRIAPEDRAFYQVR